MSHATISRCHLTSNPIAQLVDKRLEAFDQHEGGAPQLDDFYLSVGDQNVERTAADADIAAGVGHAHGDRLGARLLRIATSVSGMIEPPLSFLAPWLGPRSSAGLDSSSKWPPQTLDVGGNQKI